MKLGKNVTDIRAGRIELLAMAYAQASSEMRKQQLIAAQAKSELKKMGADEFGQPLPTPPKGGTDG